MVRDLCVNCVRAIILAMLSVFLVIGADAAEDRQTVTIAILPCSDAIVTINKFHGLVSYLEKETGLEVKLYVPVTYENFESAVRLGTIDFALQSPNTYVKLAKFFDQTSLLGALTREGQILEAGVFVVRKDSGIKSIEDLKGKTIMFGPRTSASKWTAPKLKLREKGIDIDKDLASYGNGGCCEDIVFTVYMKEVDAGVICDHFFEHPLEQRAQLGIDYGALTVVGRTACVPGRIFSPLRGVPPKIIDEVERALLRLDATDLENEKILTPPELGGFQRVKDEDYDSMRTMLDL